MTLDVVKHQMVRAEKRGRILNRCALLQVSIRCMEFCLWAHVQHFDCDQLAAHAGAYVSKALYQSSLPVS